MLNSSRSIKLLTALNKFGSSGDENPLVHCSVGGVLWKELCEEVVLHFTDNYSIMFFIAYTFKGQVHVFAGQVKIVSHSSCRTSAILKYFCPLQFMRNSALENWVKVIKTK